MDFSVFPALMIILVTSLCFVLLSAWSMLPADTLDEAAIVVVTSPQP